MRLGMRVAGVAVIAATVFVLIPYVGLGPGGEARGLDFGDWAAWSAVGLLMALVGFGTGSVLIWGAARLRRRGRAGPDEDPGART